MPCRLDVVLLFRYSGHCLPYRQQLVNDKWWLVTLSLPLSLLLIQLLSLIQFFCDPVNCSLPGSLPLCPWDFPGKNTGRVATSFSRASSWSRNQTCVSYIGRRTLYHWATREAHHYPYSSSNDNNDIVIIIRICQGFLNLSTNWSHLEIFITTSACVPAQKQCINSSCVSPWLWNFKRSQVILLYRQVWEPLSQRQQDAHLYRHTQVHTLTRTHTSWSAPPRCHEPCHFDDSGVLIIWVSQVIWGNKQPLNISPSNNHSGAPPGSTRWAQQSGFTWC